jgi:hypothetical protein
MSWSLGQSGDSASITSQAWGSNITQRNLLVLGFLNITRTAETITRITDTDD